MPIDVDEIIFSPSCFNLLWLIIFFQSTGLIAGFANKSSLLAFGLVINLLSLVDSALIDFWGSK